MKEVEGREGGRGNWGLLWRYIGAQQALFSLVESLALVVINLSRGQLDTAFPRCPHRCKREVILFSQAGIT